MLEGVLGWRFQNYYKLIIGNIPHDWLFAEGRVSAVCHHGGEPLVTVLR